MRRSLPNPRLVGTFIFQRRYPIEMFPAFFFQPSGHLYHPLNMFFKLLIFHPHMYLGRMCFQPLDFKGYVVYLLNSEILYILTMIVLHIPSPCLCDTPSGSLQHTVPMTSPSILEWIEFTPGSCRRPRVVQRLHSAAAAAVQCSRVQWCIKI